jgi:flagellar hook protein FlgE
MGGSGMISALSGMRFDSDWMDVLGGDIAAISTVGFEAGSVTFEDRLVTTVLMRQGRGSEGGPSGVFTTASSIVPSAISTPLGMGGGFLESSHSDLIRDMTGMILAQRGFQLNARVVSAQSHMWKSLVGLGE